MSDLKLFRLEKGDSQKNLVDKINQNFSNIVTFGGGPKGIVGEIGAQGDQGFVGPIGSFGSPGKRGSLWTVSSSEPSPTGGINGDFWLDSSDFNTIYQLNSNSWQHYGFSFLGQDLFRIAGPISTNLGVSQYSGYYLSSVNPELNTLVLSDNNISDNSVFANPQYSKLVVSIISGATGKNLLEFSKSDFANLSSFSSSTPKFFWSDRSTTNYNLSFRTGGRFSSSLSGDLRLISQNFGSNLNLRSNGLFINTISSSQFLSRSQTGNITLDFKTTGTANINCRNLRYSSNFFNLSTSFSFTSLPSNSNPPLWLSNSISSVGGFRHKINLSPSRSSLLFRALDTTNSQVMFQAYSDGETYYNRKVDSIQPSYSLSPLGSGNVDIGTTVSVSWYPVVPTVAITSPVPNSVVCNNGKDFVISPTSSGPSTNCGIYLWTPATGAVSNPGWQNLLSNSQTESISFSVKTDSESKLIRFLGLGLGQTYSVLPSGAYLFPTGNGIFADLSGNLSIGASQVDFTIVNFPSVGNVQGNSRWFKVYYSAYGGNLGSMVCGVLYNLVITSSVTNIGVISINSASLTKVAPLPTANYLSGVSISPSQSVDFSPTFDDGTALSLSVTFASIPSYVEAYVTAYPSLDVFYANFYSGSGTTRTIGWDFLDFLTLGSTAYQISILAT